MKALTRSKYAIIFVAIFTVIVSLILGAMLHKSFQPKFRDLTVELGTESIRVSDFLAPHVKNGKVSFVSDPGAIDLNRVGSTPVTLRYGTQQQTVTFTVVDTTAPAAVFVERLETDINHLPQASDFVTGFQDEDSVNIRFETPLSIPKDYTDQVVTVVVEDASGNAVSQDCVVAYTWLKQEFHLEYGEALTKADMLLDPLRDDSLIDQAAVDAVNEGETGTYEVPSTLGGKTLICSVIVADTQGPALQLKDVQVRLGRDAKLDDFIDSVDDISGVADVRYVTEPDFSTESKQVIVIEAVDTLGNISTQEATLWIATDFYAPVIYGAEKTLSVEKHSTPDYLEGVTAHDTNSGDCEVTVDASNVDLTKAGTYYITYYSTDNSGNTASIKRAVIVEHDEEDTLALVKSIAANLSDDPEKLRDYVRYNVGYNTNWGGDDPVWYGFTRRVGNCYVHALCLQALFDEKGIESQLIWVTDKSHYWLIVKIGDTWRHIDATPGTRHTRYSLMTDQQRFWTLSGRDWDRESWPKCE